MQIYLFLFYFKLANICCELIYIMDDCYIPLTTDDIPLYGNRNWFVICFSGENPPNKTFLFALKN